jgi:hypothetical protein
LPVGVEGIVMWLQAVPWRLLVGVSNLFRRDLRADDRVCLSGGYEAEPEWLGGQEAY